MDRDNSGADDPVNRGLLDRYRQASAELDERPAASARASILAAAAREVGARPAPAGVKQGPVDAAAKPRARPRWPLAAAAAVMLSTLAVMLAIRTNEEMPQFGAPPEPARRAAENAAPASPPASPMPVQPPAEREAKELPKLEGKVSEQQRTLSRQSAARSEPPAARAKTESDTAAQTPREMNRPASADVPATKPADAVGNMQENARANAPVVAPRSSPTETPALSKQRAEKAAAGAAAKDGVLDQAGADTRRDAGRVASPAPSVAAEQTERKQLDETAATWLERIIKLRREGRHDEADAELKRFRERYPQVQPPSEALAPTGTR